MTEYGDEYDDETPEDETEPQGKRNWRRELEAQAKEGKRAKAEAENALREAETAKRELAVLKAGIDLNSPEGKLFLRAYDGEPTVDAVKAAAAEYGLARTDEQEQQVQQELAAHEQMTRAGNAAGPTPTALDQAMQELDQVEFGDVNGVLNALQKAGIGVDNSQPGGAWLNGPGAVTKPIDGMGSNVRL